MDLITVDYHIGTGTLAPLHTIEAEYSFLGADASLSEFYQGIAMRAAIICHALNENMEILDEPLSPEEEVYAALHPQPDPLPITEQEACAVKMMDRVYQRGTKVQCECDAEDIFCISARNVDGTVATLIVYLATTDVSTPKRICLKSESLDKGCVNVFALDADHTFELIPYECDEVDLYLTLPPNSVFLVEGRIK